MWKQMIKQSFQEPEYYKGIYLNKEIQFSFCGYEDCKKGHKFGPFVRNYFIIHYIKSGKGTFEIGTRKYHLEKKQGFLIVPNVETTYYADNKEPWSYYWLAFNGTSILPLLNKMNLSLSNPVFTYEGDTDIGRLFTETLEPAQSNDIAYLRQMRLLYTFLHEISIGRNLEDTKADQDIYILKATQYIKAYLHKSISVTEIADYIGIDRSYLTRIFKNHFQLSVKESMIQLKIDTAKDMLKKKNLTIKHIANAVGYVDSFGFSRMFKGKTGYSPTEYRKIIGTPQKDI